MIDRDPKEIFVEKLADTHIDWKEYCCMLINLTVAAEIREKEFCEQSIWWYNAINEIDEKLTTKQKQYFDQVFMDWLDKNET